MARPLLVLVVFSVAVTAGCRSTATPKHATGDSADVADQGSTCWDGGTDMSVEQRENWMRCQLATFSHDREPMTPRKVSQIAYFMGTHYKTQQECQGHCATGQCLPYKTREGADERGCVIRCKAGKECPAGLACNCGHPSTECTSIVSFLEGDIYGFCLASGSDGGGAEP